MARGLSNLGEKGGGMGTAPAQPWITSSAVRGKNPKVDLKLKYQKTFNLGLAASFVIHATVAAMYPTFDIQAGPRTKEQIVIQMEDLPETRQIERPPPPPRPAVPIETESDDVPDDVTIESTDLDFDEAPIDLPPPPPPSASLAPADEEEILEFFSVEEVPRIKQQVKPVYPEVARKAMLEGRVFLRFVVGKDGRVKQVIVLRGPEIFREAAIDAVSQFRFSPAIQNDKPVRVWMSMPITFQLSDRD